MAERIIHDVNIELSDDVSRMMGQAVLLSQANRPGMVSVDHESFSGLRYIDDKYFEGRKDLVGYSNADGIGTKVEIAERLGDHSVAAYDLFAMAADDAAARGAEPLGITTVLDISQLEDNKHTRQAIDQLIEGYVGAALTAQVVILNGEVAVLGDRVGGYGAFNYNWCAVINWKAHKSRLISGRRIEPGHSLIGLAERGFRSNGITDVRKAMLSQYGEHWHDQKVPELGPENLGRLAQAPSIIYTPFINELTGGYRIEIDEKADVTGIAHITGGGQPSKLGRMLEPSGLGAVIDNPIEPPKIMLHVQKLRDFSDETVYGKLHMGPGMVIVTPEPEKVLAEAKSFGLAAKRIGEVTEEPGIRIRNRGAEQEEEWLTF